jgi:mannose-6-phosphate isomerase-like protein (cupin superfamily)
MTLIKGKDVPTTRLWECCGCWLKAYPIPETSDLGDFLVSPGDIPDPEPEKWPFQPHSHPDFEEFWFVCKGKGEWICGDKVYEVEEGDLMITPRGVTHAPGAPEKFSSDFKMICFGCKHNVFGKTVAPHSQYRGDEEVYRPDPSLPKAGEVIEVDMSSEHHNQDWEDYAAKHGFKPR